MTPPWFWPMVGVAALCETLALALLYPPPQGWRAELASYAHPPVLSLERQSEQRNEAFRIGEQLKKQQQMHCTSLPGESLHCE